MDTKAKDETPDMNAPPVALVEWPLHYIFRFMVCRMYLQDQGLLHGRVVHSILSKYDRKGCNESCCK